MFGIFLLKHADESLSTDHVGPLAESVVGNVIARSDRRHSRDLSAGLRIKNQEHGDFPCTNKQAVIVFVERHCIVSPDSRKRPFSDGSGIPVHDLNCPRVRHVDEDSITLLFNLK